MHLPGKGAREINTLAKEGLQSTVINALALEKTQVCTELEEALIDYKSDDITALMLY